MLAALSAEAPMLCMNRWQMAAHRGMPAFAGNSAPHYLQEVKASGWQPIDALLKADLMLNWVRAN